ncbi:AEC family transporter [Oscillatoria sp. FACHB-1406]|uniref:AEC family transporter n=1 Tax=Oscillatoria sp. FACHB-1406 TaxID=2692846 RepID=UPI0016843FE9|nr:AEC family transporter [Oscillatoria sp. FACHB-1406]MBD2579952.1 AEC family transporter [Oscillatoria sp. FACHB-1406]
MTDLGSQLLILYLRLGSGVVLGWGLGRILPATVPAQLGRFLYWVGVPLSVIAFLRGAKLSGAVWLAPAIAWLAIGLGASLALLWLKFNPKTESKLTQADLRAFQGSFLLSSMVGNTAYLGYPIVLGLGGERYFAWALFYDLGGTLFGAYGLGVAIAARLGATEENSRTWFAPLLNNPTLWSVAVGLGLRRVALPEAGERGLHLLAWTTVALSLVLMGMRLSQIRFWKNWQPAAVSLTIKMLLVPSLLGMLLSQFGALSWERFVLVLQMAMPPAFATLVIAETYDLDRELAVTSLSLGTIALLLILPMWVVLFSPT